MASGHNSRATNFARFFSVAEDRGITFEEAIVRTKDKKRDQMCCERFCANTKSKDRRGGAMSIVRQVLLILGEKRYKVMLEIRCVASASARLPINI